MVLTTLDLLHATCSAGDSITSGKEGRWVVKPLPTTFPAWLSEGSKRGIGINAEVKSVKYELLGICGKEVRTDGVFKGETTLTAGNSKAEQIGVYLTGDES